MFHYTEIDLNDNFYSERNQDFVFWNMTWLMYWNTIILTPYVTFSALHWSSARGPSTNIEMFHHVSFAWFDCSIDEDDAPIPTSVCALIAFCWKLYISKNDLKYDIYQLHPKLFAFLSLNVTNFHSSHTYNGDYISQEPFSFQSFVLKTQSYL